MFFWVLRGSKYLTPFPDTNLFALVSMTLDRSTNEDTKEDLWNKTNQDTRKHCVFMVDFMGCIVFNLSIYIYISKHMYIYTKNYLHSKLFIIQYVTFPIVVFFSDPTAQFSSPTWLSQRTWGSLSQYFRASICPWFALEQIIAGKWRCVMNFPSLDSMVKFHNDNVNKPTFIYICNLHIWLCMYSTYISYTYIYIYTYACIDMLVHFVWICTCG